MIPHLRDRAGDRRSASTTRSRWLRAAGGRGGRPRTHGVAVTAARPVAVDKRGARPGRRDRDLAGPARVCASAVASRAGSPAPVPAPEPGPAADLVAAPPRAAAELAPAAAPERRRRLRTGWSPPLADPGDGLATANARDRLSGEVRAPIPGDGGSDGADPDPRGRRIRFASRSHIEVRNGLRRARRPTTSSSGF